VRGPERDVETKGVPERGCAVRPRRPSRIGNLRFAQCMRAHGADVADPDPKTGDMTTPHSTQS
jgi:hypothetical protein